MTERGSVPPDKASITPEELRAGRAAFVARMTKYREEQQQERGVRTAADLIRTWDELEAMGQSSNFGHLLEVEPQFTKMLREYGPKLGLGERPTLHKMLDAQGLEHLSASKGPAVDTEFDHNLRQRGPGHSMER